MADFRTSCSDGIEEQCIFFSSKLSEFSVCPPAQILADGVCVSHSSFCLAMLWRSPWLTYYQLCLRQLLVWHIIVSGMKGAAE